MAVLLFAKPSHWRGFLRTPFQARFASSTSGVFDLRTSEHFVLLRLPVLFSLRGFPHKLQGVRIKPGPSARGAKFAKQFDVGQARHREVVGEGGPLRRAG